MFEYLDSILEITASLILWFGPVALAIILPPRKPYILAVSVTVLPLSILTFYLSLPSQQLNPQVNLITEGDSKPCNMGEAYFMFNAFCLTFIWAFKRLVAGLWSRAIKYLKPSSPAAPNPSAPLSERP